MKVSVIIPFYNNWELTHSRLMELYTHVDPLEIILVNDCSTDNVGGRKWWESNTKHNIVCLDNDINLGFGGSMNRGVEESTGNFVILLSNDVIVRGDIVSQTLDKYKKNSLLGNTLRDYDTGWNVFEYLGRKRMFPYIEGYYIACDKHAWEELGGFDPIFAPYDMEDVDLSTSAILNGYNLVALNSQYLSHMSGQTIRKVNPQRETITNMNRQKFYMKWTRILDGDW